MEITVHLYANKLENLGDIENFLRENFFFFIKTVTTEKIESLSRPNFIELKINERYQTQMTQKRILPTL